jgi:hypothetical protein
MLSLAFAPLLKPPASSISTIFPAVLYSTSTRACTTWRPTVDDVIRISYGKPAKNMGTGSRGVPHRLNADERELFDIASRKGFLAVSGSGHRRERAGSPLVNTWRSFCDASAQASITIFKCSTGIDSVVLDVSPLRSPASFSQRIADCLASHSVAAADAPGPPLVTVPEVADAEPWSRSPMYNLPAVTAHWKLPRADAKVLLAALALHFGTVSSKPRPERHHFKKPDIKHGKRRRSGGIGIGGS